MKHVVWWFGASLLVMAVAPAWSGSNSVPVNVSNFARAESDLYFGRAVKQNGLGKLGQVRMPVAIDNQQVIRMNRDTIYSSAVFDLDAGPVTVTPAN